MSKFRGRRPPEAENRARQIRGKLVWHRTAALGFGRRKPTASPPTSREVRWKREAHIYISPRRRRPEGRASGGADEHTLKGDRPAEREGKQGTMEAHSMQRARRGGVGSPKGNRWMNANARANAAAPKANAQIGINGDSSRTMAFGAGRGVCSAIGSPEKSAFISLSFRRTTASQPHNHHTTTTNAPHAPLGLRIEF